MQITLTYFFDDNIGKDESCFNNLMAESFFWLQSNYVIITSGNLFVESVSEEN